MGDESDHRRHKEQIFSELRFRNLRVKNRLFRSNLSGMFDDYNGHGGNARLNWEEKFARGGIGASSPRLHPWRCAVASSRATP